MTSRAALLKLMQVSCNPSIRSSLLGSSSRAAVAIASTNATTSSSTRFMSSTSTSATEEEEYHSPLDDYLNSSSNGITALGTTKFHPKVSNKLECGIDEDDLRFKTTCYGRLLLPPYVQGHEHQVTVNMPWHKLPLNEFEKSILHEIVTSRYNQTSQMLQLTSDQFGSRIENKRHLVTMLNRLVFAARKLAKQVHDEINDNNSNSTREDAA